MKDEEKRKESSVFVKKKRAKSDERRVRGEKISDLGGEKGEEGNAE